MSIVFESILVHPEVETWRYKYAPQLEISHIVDKIKIFVEQLEYIKNSQIRKLKDGLRLYKIRINKSDRLVFSITGADNNLILKLHMMGNHRNGEQAHKQVTKWSSQKESEFDSWDLEIQILNDDQFRISFEKPNQLYYCWNEVDRTRLANNTNAQLWWKLDTEQERIATMTGPVILKGCAGSGKTTIALYRLLGLQINSYMSDKKSLYLTYSEKLKENAQELFENLKYTEKNNRFETIEDFLLTFIEEEKERINFEGFKKIIKTKKNKYSANFSDELLWEEFRGILKGCVYLGINLKPYLIETQYLNLITVGLVETDSLFSVEQRKEVYRLFRLYQNYLQIHNLWDELDLAFHALIRQKQGYIQQYDQIIVDEIQDIPSIHLQVILNSLNDMQGLFLTGDAQQAIHPSRFLWSRLNDQIHQYIEIKNINNLYKIKTKNTVQNISLNYRCSQQIINLLNELSIWRNKQFSEEKLHLNSIYSGQPLVYLNILKQLVLYNANELAVNIMIIVPNDLIQQQLTNDEDGIFRFVKYNVFTIHQSKGLESEYVILYKFFDEYKIFDNVIKRGGSYVKKHLHQLKYYSNLFNVACSRARTGLLLIDNELPQFPPLNTIKEKDNLVAENFLKNLVSLKSNIEDKIKHAQQLERNRSWLQAAELWKKLNRLNDYYRCQAFILREKNEWYDAAILFQRIQEFDLAYECFEKAHAYDEMLEVLLQHPNSSYVDPLITLFFQDPNKINQLGSNYLEKLIHKVKDPQSLIKIPIIFKYCQHKVYLIQQDILKNELELEKINHPEQTTCNNELHQFSVFLEGISNG